MFKLEIIILHMPLIFVHITHNLKKYIYSIQSFYNLITLIDKHAILNFESHFPLKPLQELT